MNDDTKKQLPELGKIGMAILVGAALVGGITYVALGPAAPPKMLSLTWDVCDDPNAWYEFASTTNLGKDKSWYFKARIPPTNRCYFPMTNGQEFFAIRAALPYVTGPTNNPVTNWIYSDYSQSH